MNGMLRSPVREIISYRAPAASPASNASVNVNVNVNMRFIMPPLLKEHGCIT